MPAVLTRRSVLGLVVGGLAAFGLPGCVAIKSESSNTQAPGVVTISLTICASQRVSGSNCIPPNNSGGLTPNTVEGDNGSNALISNDPNNPSKGQLVVGFR